MGMDFGEVRKIERIADMWDERKLNPQIVIDNENDEEFGIVDFEFGWIMSKWKPDLKGHSFYIRPSVGVGSDRPTDGSIYILYGRVKNV
jgi:hypothetical protein